MEHSLILKFYTLCLYLFQVDFAHMKFNFANVNVKFNFASNAKINFRDMK